MTLSMYQASAPVLLHQLDTLSNVLSKGEAHAAGSDIPPATLIEARLAPDMFPLSRQVQIATDMAKGGIARLAGAEVPSFPDDERDFRGLKARIAKTIGFIGGIQSEAVDAGEMRDIVIELPDREIRMTGQPFLFHFMLPNFFFHVTTAYAILRAHGVPLGKADYLGGF